MRCFPLSKMQGAWGVGGVWGGGYPNAHTLTCSVAFFFSLLLPKGGATYKGVVVVGRPSSPVTPKVKMPRRCLLAFPLAAYTYPRVQKLHVR